jgi:hypothetical protein|tara:strand:+ start:281 stop:592 length:312 start_codon:yes stop_codon:yes gene_type:complete
MIQPKSIIIGISATIILIKFCEFYLFESELLSSLAYTFTFSFLYEMLSNMNKKKGILLEGYSAPRAGKGVGFAEFEGSDSFKGKKPGYVFKKDDKGTGYYLDK